MNIDYAARVVII